MFTKLILATLSINTLMVANTNFLANQEQPKKPTQNAFTETLENNVLDIEITTDQQDFTEGYTPANSTYWLKSKTKASGRYFYAEMYNYTVKKNTVEQQQRYENQDHLYVLQITPYYTMTDTTMNLSFDIKNEIEEWDIVDYEWKARVVYGNEYRQYTDMNISGLSFEGMVAKIAQIETKTSEDPNVQDLGGGTLEISTREDEHILELEDIQISNQNTYYVIIFGNIYDYAYMTEESNLWYISKTKANSPIQPIPPTEVIDIKGLMFQILTMPFAFISQAFDLTLFPGTPYAINISNLFLGIIGVAIFIWLIKLILGKVSIGDIFDGNVNKPRKNAQDRQNEALTKSAEAEKKITKGK